MKILPSEYKMDLPNEMKDRAKGTAIPNALVRSLSGAGALSRPPAGRTPPNRLKKEWKTKP